MPLPKSPNRFRGPVSFNINSWETSTQISLQIRENDLVLTAHGKLCLPSSFQMEHCLSASVEIENQSHGQIQSLGDGISNTPQIHSLIELNAYPKKESTVF